MTRRRKTSPALRKRLKIATQRTLEDCGAQEFIAPVTRVSQKTLSDYQNTENDRHEDTFMPVDVLADLILDCKGRGEIAPLLTYLCELAGGAFVQVPADTAPDDAVALVDGALKQMMTLRDCLVDGEGAA
ncbi:MAG: hypothetical protein ABJL55_16470 [Roseibium sp.]